MTILGGWAATELYFYPAYGTDEAAFVQYAAHLALHGHNPYKTNLLPALTQFRVPIQYATYKLDGTIASSLSYPSLSFLLIVPFLSITNGVQTIILLNIVFLAAEMLILFVVMPRQYRSLAPLIVLGLPFLFDYTVGGDIVTFSVPFLLIVAYHWTETGRYGRLGPSGTAKAICLGLAASISQFAWFVAPFVAIGIWRMRQPELGNREATKVVARYVAIEMGIALGLAIGYTSCHQWRAPGQLPRCQHAIPFGQGLIDAPAFFHIGGGNLSYYTDAAAGVFAVLLIAYFQHFHRLWRATFILPSIAFFFSTRSLSEYFIMMVALWVVAVVVPGDPPRPQVDETGEDRTGPAGTGAAREPWLWRGALLGLAALGSVAFVVLAIAAPAPLGIHIRSVETNGEFRSIWRMEIQVTNRSNQTLTPHFATDASGYLTTFWNVVSGPARLRPHQISLYTLVAPNVGSMPGVTQPFLLQAVTASPQTLSSSNLFTPEPFDSEISPSYVNRVVPLRQAVTLDVGLLSPYGAPVHQRGVRVALGQIVYALNDLLPEAQINGEAQGKSPVTALTTGDGIAHFKIRDTQVQGGNPLYFQAYIDPAQGFPYGYSRVVSVQWGDSSPTGRT